MLPKRTVPVIVPGDSPLKKSLWRYQVETSLPGSTLKAPGSAVREKPRWLLFKLFQFYFSGSPTSTLITIVPPGKPESPSPALDPGTSRAQNRRHWKFQKCAPGTCELLQKAAQLGREHCPLGAFSKIPFIHSPECRVWHLEDFKGSVISQLQGM